MTPKPRLEWTPGPTGKPEPPTLAELSAGLLSEQGNPGVTMEVGRPAENMAVVNVVRRDDTGVPIGILQLRYYDGAPELIDVAVAPEHQRRGIAWQLCTTAKDHGIDLRELGSVHEGPLTDEGRALRDAAFARGAEIYGPASYEES